MLLSEFEAMPYQDAALNCDDPVQLIRGGNRSGKTLVGGIKVSAQAVDGCIRLSDGTRSFPGGVKSILCVGKDWEHIGLTMTPLIFGSALEISKTPGLIGVEYVSGAIWHQDGNRRVDKGNGQVSRVFLTTGCEITFAPSFDLPGREFDFVWLDEKPMFDEHILELMGQGKKFLWTTWPTSTCAPLRELSDHIQKPSTTGASEFRFKMMDNTKLPETSREDLIQAWGAMGDAHLAARNLGEFCEERENDPRTFSVRTLIEVRHGSGVRWTTIGDAHHSAPTAKDAKAKWISKLGKDNVRLVRQTVTRQIIEDSEES